MSLASLSPAPPPQRLVMRAVTDLGLSVLSRLGALHGQRMVDAVLFATLLSGNLQPAMARREDVAADLADPSERPISALGLAASLGLPRETVRRRLAVMAERGFCRRQGAHGYVVPPERLRDPDTAEALAAIEGEVLRVAADLRAIGFDFDDPTQPRAPERDIRLGPCETRPGLTALRALDFFVRSLEATLPVHGRVTDGLVYTAILHLNAEPFARDPQAAWRYAGADDQPAETTRRPVTTAEVSRLLQVDKETVRRAVVALAEGERIVAGRGRGYVVAVGDPKTPQLMAAGVQLYGEFLRLFRELRRDGLALA